jgi:thiamine biosynthesis lipoprotein
MRRSRDEFGPAGRSVSRRDLFRLRGRPGTASPEQPRSSAYDLINAARSAMGSYFEVRLPAATPGAVDLASRALDIVDALEFQMTVYRDDSEIAALNASADLGPVVVEPRLFALLERAVGLWAATGGAYDVTSGALSTAWGFTRGPRRVPDAETLADALARTGSQHLTLDPAARSVAFDRPGIGINLGSIGKGYAIDRAAEVIRDHWFPTSALIHGGRSSLYALGSPPDRFGGRWEVAVRNPLDPEAPVGSVLLRNRGMGTSGAAFQQFEEGGRLYGHLIDARTGEPPADGPLSVSVLAPTAAEADALSTAFYLLGDEATAAYVAEHPEIGVIVLRRGDDPVRPVVFTWGLTDADFVRAGAGPRPSSLLS